MRKPTGSRRRRKRNRSNVKRKLSIRKKSGGASIGIVVHGHDSKEPNRSCSLDIDTNTPLQMSELKTLLLNEYHSISSITKVTCLIEEQMDDGLESYIGLKPFTITNDTDNIPTNTQKIEIHPNDYTKVKDTIIDCVLTDGQYSVDNTNYTLTINTDIIQKKYNELIHKNIQPYTRVFTQIENRTDNKTMVSNEMYFQDYKNVFTIDMESDMQDQVDLSVAKNIQIKLCFVLT